jgi:predicted nucleic acid-binding Zn ribbon protein
MDAIADVLKRVIGNLSSPVKQRQILLAEKWPAIAGERVAAHTKPALGKDGKLWIWVDQSALAFELSRRYAPALLKRVQAELGSETVKRLVFRVGQLR